MIAFFSTRKTLKFYHWLRLRSTWPQSVDLFPYHPLFASTTSSLPVMWFYSVTVEPIRFITARLLSFFKSIFSLPNLSSGCLNVAKKNEKGRVRRKETTQLKRTSYYFLIFLRSSALMYRQFIQILNCFDIFSLHLFQCYLIDAYHLNLGLPNVCSKVYFYLSCEVRNITKLCATFSVAGYEKYVNVRHCHENINYQHSSTDSLTLVCFISCDVVFVHKESARVFTSLGEGKVEFPFFIYLFHVRSVKVR